MSGDQPKIGFGVMILRAGKVLLGRRNDDPEKAGSELHGEGTWTMPGGKLHFKEKLTDGAKREVYEETGIRIIKKKLRLISVADDFASDAHFVTIGFLYREKVGIPRVMEPNEITEWEWFSLTDLPKKVFPPSMEVIEAYKNKLTYPDP